MISQSLRIFLIGPSFPFRGGISHYTTLLFNHLIKQHQVCFYTHKKQYLRFLYPGRTDRDLSREGILPAGRSHPAHAYETGPDIKRQLHPLNPIPWIRAGISARRFDLILLSWWTIFWAPHYLLFLSLAKTKRNRVIFLCHNVEGHEKRKLDRVLLRHIFSKADGFVLHSQEEQNRLFQLIQKRTPTVVSPHPTYQIFNSQKYDKSTARHRLGISTSGIVILFFGFIRKYKGLEYLLKALPFVKGNDPEALLLIVGEVWEGREYQSFLRRMLHDLGIQQNVRFINRYINNEDVEPFFKAADFVVLPYIEGTGSGILQLCYGMNKPVIASSIGAFVEYVENGKTGFIVPPKDEKQLAEAILKMYGPGVINMLEQGVRQKQIEFGWQRLVEQIISLFYELSADAGSRTR